ncbi:uncharacterized protein LOC130733807 [Lotus japonicus]|uniref:uncharacterized protein LOC130733807 n=1 Tax=Lotus japonicus TaxID=34305 RepID=UPI002585961C|nr:uncharacterized protein LOC130733807 [Lotus japonicus]
MAEATRLQSSIREAEERITATIEPCISRHLRELEQRFELQLNGFQEAMRGLGLQMTEMSSRRRGANDGEHRMPTRLTRLDFPKFNRDEAESWLVKCERFFTLDNTPEAEKVAIASIAMDESSFRWFQTLEQSTTGPVSWMQFSDAVKVRFGTEFDSPLEELKRLVQTGTLEDYQEAFDTLAARTDLSEPQKLQVYLGGLCAELSNGVKMFAPRTLLEATRIAKLQERSIELLQKRTVSGVRSTGAWSDKRGNSSFVEKKLPEKKPGGDSNQKGILGKPNYTFQRKLSPKEMEEHRAQNLCFFCHEKFSPGHDCPQRKKFQVFLMEVEEGEPEAVDSASSVDSEPVVPTLSLNAIHGDSEYPLMRLTAWIGKKRIHVLIDSGSSHNFIDQKLCKEGLSYLRPVHPLLKPLQVTVAGGGVMQGTGLCDGIQLKMQGYDFFTSAIALPLGSFDLILGLQWLTQWGTISWDFKALVMEFDMGHLKVRLQADKSGKDRVVSAAKLNQIVAEESFCFMLQLFPCSQEKVCCALGLEEPEDPATKEHKTTVLEEFKDVFEEPTQLPPFRGIHDHQIVLKEGSNPVSLRPYRYPPAQKDVIDNMVKELLDSGVIQPSSSPFASPVVLVKKKDGSWRMCVDYRKLNDMTVKAKFPIPLVEDLLDELGGAQIFSKLDLRSGYHQIRMKPEDIAKTAFQTHGGQYEYVVMPFGLSNAPATFQGTMNVIFASLLRKCVLIFFDDILVYSKSIVEHVAHLRHVFTVLKTHSFYVKRSKCAFFTTRIEYLGHFITPEGVTTDPAKIMAVQEWPELRHLSNSEVSWASQVTTEDSFKITAC